MWSPIPIHSLISQKHLIAYHHLIPFLCFVPHTRLKHCMYFVRIYFLSSGSQDHGRDGYEARLYSFSESSKYGGFQRSWSQIKVKSHSLGFVPCLLFVYFILCMGRGRPRRGLPIITTINQSQPIFRTCQPSGQLPELLESSFHYLKTGERMQNYLMKGSGWPNGLPAQDSGPRRSEGP